MSDNVATMIFRVLVLILLGYISFALNEIRLNSYNLKNIQTINENIYDEIKKSSREKTSLDTYLEAPQKVEIVNRTPLEVKINTGFMGRGVPVEVTNDGRSNGSSIPIRVTP